jgi:hypothetical protein
MKITIKFFLIMMMMFSMSCSNEPITDAINGAQDVDVFSRSNNSKSKTNKSTVDVINPILGIVTGTSTLHRNSSGITVNYKTTGLTPGYAYTIWWVIWNNPQECAVPGACNDSDFATPELVGVDVLYAAGHVVDDSGVGNFSGRLNVDDDSKSINDLFGLPPAGGLQSGNTYSAEVHLVLRSHGPAIPGEVNEQISGYLGGCSDPFAIAPFTEIPDEVGECGDIEFAIHSPVN